MLRDVLIKVKGLSNREAEVVELIAKGLSDKEIAHQLFITKKTVKFHLENIKKRGNWKSRAKLIVWCLPHIAPESPATAFKSEKKVEDRVEPEFGSLEFFYQLMKDERKVNEVFSAPSNYEGDEYFDLMNEVNAD